MLITVQLDKLLSKNTPNPIGFAREIHSIETLRKNKPADHDSLIIKVWSNEQQILTCFANVIQQDA